MTSRYFHRTYVRDVSALDGGKVDVAIIGHGNTFRTMTIAFYSANEAISILENASNLGLPLPQGIKDVLERFMKGKS